MLCCGSSSKKRDKAVSFKDFDVKLLSQRFRFSREDLILYKHRFMQMCRGRTISLEEFRENMGLLGLESTRMIADRIFRVIDKNNSREIDLEEYLEYMDILLNGTKEEKSAQSFKLISNGRSDTVTYEDFVEWLISVWKMYNALTGLEVSASQDTIKTYFNELDLKKDGVIDLEEYQTATENTDFLFEWFDFLNQGMKESLIPVSEEPHEEREKTAIDEIEEELKACVRMLENEQKPAHWKRSFTDMRVSRPKVEINEISIEIVSEESEELFENFEEVSFQGDNDLPEDIDSDESSPKPRFDIRKFDSTLFESDEKANFKMSIVKLRLENILSKIKKLKKTDFQEESKIEPWAMIIARPDVKKNKAIYWGDKDWNLILNMMLGIQKAVRASSANFDECIDLTEAEFAEKAKLTLQPSHTRVSTKNFKFRDYAPQIFERIRNFYEIRTVDYVKSLGVEKIMHSLMMSEFSSLEGQCSTGKSGSFFYFSDDGKYMLKTIPEEEFIFFRKILPDYYIHIMENPHTLITRFFGLHKIILSRKKRLTFVVMGNVFKTGHKIDEIYDLKGSTLGRQTNPSESSAVPRKDLDFLALNRKVSIGKENKQYFMLQLERDAEFLRELHIIDYSLLVGVHKCTEIMEKNKIKKNVRFVEKDEGGILSTDENSLYFLGVIDILTHYGTRKKFERFFKGTIHKKKAVSCAPPDFYAQRFVNFIDSCVD